MTELRTVRKELLMEKNRVRASSYPASFSMCLMHYQFKHSKYKGNP
jgi:hypothetical protein